MYFKDIAYALKEEITLDNKFRPIVSYTESLIYCNVKSVGQTEFYQSATAGFKPEIKLETKLLDLDGISHIKYNRKIYKILRTYQKADVIELTLTSTIIDNSTGSLGDN